jgi:diguanylate cyclase (GGDEF)-like protein
LSTIDSLTGLPNVRGFRGALQVAAAIAARAKAKAAYLMIDVDHFKRINDELGHAEGDRILAEVGRAIRSVLRRSDIVGRVGGDEFAVLLSSRQPNATEGFGGVAEKIRKAVRDRIPCEFPATVSIGVATGSFARGEEWEVDTLRHRADGNLCRAKVAGRDRVVTDVPGFSRHERQNEREP